MYLPIVTGCVKTPETSLLSESRISSSEGSGLPVKFHQALMFLAVLRRGFKIFSCISHLSTKKIYFSIEIALVLIQISDHYNSNYFLRDLTRLTTLLMLSEPSLCATMLGMVFVTSLDQN